MSDFYQQKPEKRTFSQKWSDFKDSLKYYGILTAIGAVGVGVVGVCLYGDYKAISEIWK
ncbi:MAG: hypothetical protein LBU87_01500 [Lactobacillales bacterium]|jgi:multidrug transporter EmrE-like cation transporter|nr:hypothetical protein [Lactobacillales bacterium]